MSGSIGNPTGVGGPAPTAQTMNPAQQGMIQRYASLPVEKLQELASRMGGSPQAQVIQKIIQQKQTQPNAQPAQQAAAPMPAQTMPQPVAQRRGGTVPRRAGGGELGISGSAASPWWTRQDARQETGGGFLSGSTAGRADAIRTTAPAGAYILPADVVAGVGEGNSLAGARVLDSIFRSGPYGSAQQRMGHGKGPPTPPRENLNQEELVAKGGTIRNDADQTPVRLSHGEYQVSPEIVAAIGGGNIKRGHAVLDAWVVKERKRQIAKLKALPGPVKS